MREQIYIGMCYFVFCLGIIVLSAVFLCTQAKHTYSTHLTSMKWLSDLFIRLGAHGLAEWPFSQPWSKSIVRDSSFVKRVSAVGCKPVCRIGHRRCSFGQFSLSLALPEALHVFEALIGPELDCDRPDY